MKKESRKPLGLYDFIFAFILIAIFVAVDIGLVVSGRIKFDFFAVNQQKCEKPSQHP